MECVGAAGGRGTPREVRCSAPWRRTVGLRAKNANSEDGMEVASASFRATAAIDEKGNKRKTSREGTFGHTGKAKIGKDAGR